MATPPESWPHSVGFDEVNYRQINATQTARLTTSCRPEKNMPSRAVVPRCAAPCFAGQDLFGSGEQSPLPRRAPVRPAGGCWKFCTSKAWTLPRDPAAGTLQYCSLPGSARLIIVTGYAPGASWARRVGSMGNRLALLVLIMIVGWLVGSGLV